jgi:hypothetical protein
MCMRAQLVASLTSTLPGFGTSFACTRMLATPRVARHDVSLD